MKYVFGMLCGTALLLFAGIGVLAGVSTMDFEWLVNSLGIILFLVAGGALLLYLNYKPWKKWYDKKDKEVKDIQAMNKRLEYMRKTIVRVTIIGSGTRPSTGSALGRAAVGDMIAGDVGAIIGASTAKQKGVTKFLVEYEDHHKEVETVKDNSLRFQELIAYVET